MLCAGAAGAHEIGTTRVSAVFQEGRTFDVEIVTDATALAEKLEASVGAVLPSGTQADRLQTMPAGDQAIALAGFDGDDDRLQQSLRRYRGG